MKSLIVEDDITTQILIRKILSPYGICKEASNGKEAMNAFRVAHEKKELFDFIYLDIMMSMMDGQEVLKKIRK